MCEDLGVQCFIQQSAILSSAGSSVEDHWKAWDRAGLVMDQRHGHWCATVGDDLRRSLSDLGECGRRNRHMDRATRLAVLTARQVLTSANEKRPPMALNTAVVAGSSRGAQETLEEVSAIATVGRPMPPWASPESTAGSMASHVAQDLGCRGLATTVSAACATGMHALIAGASLTAAGVCDEAIVVGSESCLTPTMFAMLDAVGVLAPITCAEAEGRSVWPCAPFALDRGGMVLGEGAAAVRVTQERGGAAVALVGVSASTDLGVSRTGLDTSGEHLALVIQSALARAGVEPDDVDMIGAHGAGTKVGDLAEARAYARVFVRRKPAIISAKWLTGHALGASALMSIVLVGDCLRRREVVQDPQYLMMRRIPELAGWGVDAARDPRCAVVVALGFGGHAAAAVLKLVDF